MIFRLDIVTVPTVWYVLFFILFMQQKTIHTCFVTFAMSSCINSHMFDFICGIITHAIVALLN